jgi:hypothetical protein
MKKIIAAVVGITAAGMTYVNAQTNTSSFWDQNVNFILVSQSSGGHAALSTKVFIQDLIGASVTNAGTTITTNIATGVTSTNLLPGTNFPASFTNSIISGTNTNTVILSRSGTNPFAYTFNNGITTTNGAGFVFSQVPVSGQVTATVTSTNASGVPVYTLNGGTTTNTSGGVVTTVTNTAFSKTARLIARQPSPSGGNLTNQDQFLIVEGVGKKATIVADVTPFFQETFGTLIDSITPNHHYLDVGLKFTGATIRFESRVFAAITTGNAKGESQRKVFNGTLVGAGVGNGLPIVVAGKLNLTGGQVDTQ